MKSNAEGVMFRQEGSAKSRRGPRGVALPGWLSDPAGRLLIYCNLALLAVPELRLGVGKLVYPTPSETGPEYVGLPFASEVVILIALAWYVARAMASRRRLVPPREVQIAGAMAVWACAVVPVSFLLGLQESGGMFGHFRMTLEGLCLFVVTRSLAWPAKSLRKVAWVLVMVGSWHSVVVCMDYLVPGRLPLSTNITFDAGTERFASLFNQPSRAALVMMLGALAALSLLLREGRREPFARAITTGLFVLQGFGVLLTQTRASTITLALLGSLVLAIRFPAPNARLLISIAAVVLIVLVPKPSLRDEVREELFSRYQGALRSFWPSRGEIWAVSLGAIATYPLGMGYDTLLAYTQDLTPHAHNFALQWIVMFGLPSGVALCWLIVKGLRNYRARLRLEPRSDRAGVMMAMIALLGVMGTGMFEAFLETNVGWLFWLFLAVAFGATREQPRLVRGAAAWRTAGGERSVG